MASMSEDTRRTVHSFCRICTTLCGIEVEVDGDVVVRVRGDRGHPFTKGYTCPKGRALPQLHHHPERLEHPMVRVGGVLRAAGWEDTLDDLGSRLSAIIAESGPEAVGVFFGSGIGMDAAGYRLQEALFQAIGTPAKFSPLTIDGTAKTLVAHLVGGFPGFTSHIDYQRAQMALYIGVNPVVSHGHNIGLADPVSELRDLAKRAEVWVIDPRRSETARLATRHLAPRPGTDHAVLAFLVRELLRAGADQEAMGRTTGRDVLAAAVEPFDLGHAAEVSGLEELELLDLLGTVRRSGPVAVDTGTGVTMGAEHGNVTIWLAWALMIVTGAMNRPGGVWFHPGFAVDFEELDLPVLPEGALFGPGPRSRPETQSFLGEWPCAVLADEIEAGNIRALLNFGGAVLASFPDRNRLEPALRSLELLVTTDVVMTPTAALSTHVLPTKDQLERPDVSLWDFLAPQVAMQHTHAAVAPVGERRSAWWVFAEIGRRLGHDLAPAESSDDDMLERLFASPRCSWDDLVASGTVELPLEVPAPWVERYLEKSGGWRLAPPLLVDQLSRLDEPAGLVLIPRRQVKKLNAALDFLGESALVHIHPDDASAAGVVDGGAVLVRSARGELTGVAKVDDGIRRGVVSIPHGHHDANVNALTDKDVLDTLTGMVRYSAIPVTLHRPPAETRDPQGSSIR
jgi:anaerobic selenocysteine-containing dehydrogenase